MKKIKTDKNAVALRFYTTQEVFKKASRSRAFKDAYNEELNRLRLAQRVKELRVKNHLTQKALAKRVTMPQSVIARLESGEHSFSLNTLSRVAHAVGKEIQLA